MRIFLTVLLLFLVVSGWLVYRYYPTLYGIIPDTSNTPKLSDLASVPPAGQNQDLPAEVIIAEGLDTPWAIAFLPDGNLIITERGGEISIINKRGEKEVIGKVNDSKEISEGGLLGLTLHPDFNANNYVYYYYTYASDGNQTLNKVVRAKLTENKLGAEELVIDKIPGAPFHNGGRILFGPDGFLYITTGDANNPSLSQDIDSLAGKILRVTGDGKPAPLNSLRNMVFSYGHRNPQGIAWDSAGRLWETEHGPSGGSLGTGNDEVNSIENGLNYGWPLIQGDQTSHSMIPPVRSSTPSVAWAPGGTAVIGNQLFFSGLRGQALYRADISGTGLGEVRELVKGKYGRIREVIAGPDGMLYITTSNRDGRGLPNENDDRIIRLNPSKI